MKNPEEYDAIIIGSGQAGNPLAFALAAENWKVALIEKGKLGGTCVNTGCTPTKAYVASARRAWEIQNAKDLGIKVPKSIKINLKSIRKRKDKLVAESQESIKKAIDDNPNITLFRARGFFVDKNTVRAGSKNLTAPKIFLNVGARPVIPEGFEETDFLTNESILRLNKIPKHLIIVGGSYVALEFAQMFRRFGSKVTIIEKSKYLVSREDQETSELVQKILEKEGIKVICNANCVSGRNKKSGGIQVEIDCAGKKKPISGTHFLLATGRTPNTDALKLENTDIKVDDRNYIQVNTKLETTQKGVFALGDCNGKGAFTHTSYNDFEIIRDQIFGNKRLNLNNRILNYALYMDPPMGRAGMTLDEAKNLGRPILYAQIPMKDISRAKEKGETEGKMEVIVDAGTEKILGAMVLGTGGDEVIGTFLTAMYGKMKYKILMNSVQTHPTVTEYIPTLLQNLEKVNQEDSP